MSCSSCHNFLTLLPQVHLLFWWFVVRYHQNEQQPPVPPPDPHSITTKLPSRRRSVRCKPKFYNSLSCNKEKKIDRQKSFCSFFLFSSISLWICRFLPFPENLPVSPAGLHLRRLVSTFVASCPATVPCVRHFSFPCPADRCCPCRPVSVFRCRLVCAYTECNVVYHCFNELRHVLTGFMYVLSFCGCFLFLFFILWVCMFSDPQSSRERKLCMTMEPALLLKGDIMVRNSFL